MQKLTVAVSPHIHHKDTTSRIMLDVLIALIPAFAMSIFVFGARAAVVVLVCAGSCLFFEWIFEKITKRPNTVGDFSACITGVLLAFNLPVTIPIWQAVFGSAVAIILVKQLFGGLGKNFANPAITARIVMFLAFAGTMTNWYSDTSSFWTYPGIGGIDGVAGATPLYLLKDGVTDTLPSVFSSEYKTVVERFLMEDGKIGALPSLLDMFLGIRGGCIGETSALALLLGGIYLMIRRVISWHTPITYIAVVAGLSFAVGQDPVYHILAGGLFLGAFFMATDYVTTPRTNFGRLLFGLGAGIFTVLFRVFGSYPEGVMFSILLMNILTPFINKITETKPLGAVDKKS